jgi:hypothetical protein
VKAIRITGMNQDQMKANNFDFQSKMRQNHLELFDKITSLTSFEEYSLQEKNESEFRKIYELVRKNTMLPPERLYDLYLSVKYINKNKIPGAIVEVGTWRCGALATAMLADDSEQREGIGFDSFGGHFAPPDDEFDVRGMSMLNRFNEEIKGNNHWAGGFTKQDCINFLANLKQDFSYRTKLYEGNVVEILDSVEVPHIAILRIDVDWYAESKVSLEKLYPKLVPNGIIIMDDYGHHSGQRRAVDEYFEEIQIKFTHVDYSCISAVKLSN